MVHVSNMVRYSQAPPDVRQFPHPNAAFSVPDHRQVRRFPRRGLLSGAAILRAAVDSTQRRRHGSALASCQNGVFERKAGHWSGSGDDPSKPNRLLADSARWAGFQGAESDRITGLLQSMVGDTVLARGNVRVEYGPRANAYSPRSYLLSLENQIATEFCGKLLPDLAGGITFPTAKSRAGCKRSLPPAPRPRCRCSRPMSCATFHSCHQGAATAFA